MPERGALLRPSGEFADPGTEAAFLRDRVLGSAGTLRVLALLGAAGFVLFIATDLAIMGFGPEWLVAAGLRLSAGGAMAGAAWWVGARPASVATIRGWRVVLALEALCVVAFAVVAALRPVEIEGLQLSAIAMGTALLVMAPGPLRHRASMGALHYALFGLIMLTRADRTDLAPVPFAGSLLVAAGAGLAAAIHLARADRLAYASLAQARQLNLQLAERVRQVGDLHDELARQASEDFLTGLPNRRSFFARAETLFDHRRTSVACIVFDVDRFKVINDVHGHAAGDEVLRGVGQAFREALRSDDIAGRIGGEEFGVIVPVATVEEATVIANRIRLTVACRTMSTGDYGAGDIAVTVSGGLAMYEIGEKVTDVLRRADMAMYRAKAAGGNAVEVAEPVAAHGP